MLNFDTNKVLNSSSNIQNAQKALQNAKKSIDGIKTPNDYIYASSLRSISINLEDINEQINSTKNWIKEKVEMFKNVARKGINIIQLAIIGFTTESELVPEYYDYSEAMDFSNRYIDYKKYNKGCIITHRSVTDLMTDVVGKKSAKGFLNAKNRKWIIEAPIVNERISHYLYEEYSIKVSKSDISSVEWKKMEK